MATSGTFAEHSNNLAIVKAALRKIGRLGDFETFADTDVRYTHGLAALKLIAKEFTNYGMALWAIEELAIDMSTFNTTLGVDIGVSGALVTATPPVRVLSAYRRDTSGTYNIDVPMVPYTQEEYLTIPQKDETGTPTVYTFYPYKDTVVSPVNPQLKIWPMPDTYWDTNGQVVIRYQRHIEDVGTSTQDLDFPAEWQRAIVYSLAYDLAPEYGVDQTQRMALKADRDQLVAQALGGMTEEGSFFIQPVRSR